jgi:DNA repair protein RadD
MHTSWSSYCKRAAAGPAPTLSPEPPTMQLRDYQQAALDSLFTYFGAHPDPTENPVVAMPVGSGKAPTLGAFCHKVLTWWPGQRILQLVHTRELVDQNAKTMRRIWPQAPLGVFSAGLNQRVAHMPLTFAGIASVAANLELFGRQDLLIVDECHLISEKETTTYQKVIAYFRALNPHLRVIGFTATPYRVGMGRITEGGLFTHICYDCTNMAGFNHLLDEGYLCRLVPIRTQAVIDVSNVSVRAGDFALKELQEAPDLTEITRAAFKEAMVAAKDRRHWLVFAAGVERAKEAAEMLRTEFGISAGVVLGDLSNSDRDGVIDAFKRGEIRALVNNGVLTTGFDFPALDCILMLRATTSVVLHIQMLGRGTRPCYAEGFDLSLRAGRLAAIEASHKPNCLVLDFAGNVSRLGPINDPRIPKRRGKGPPGEIPVKLCEECGCLNHIVNRVCDNCGEAFPIQTKITEQASTAEVIAQEEPPHVLDFEVNRRTFGRHSRPGKPLMLKVSYFCGIQRFTEYVLLEHYSNKGRQMAVHWWHEVSGQRDWAPASVEEAERHLGTLRQPTGVRVWVNKPGGKPEIMSHLYS